MKEKRVVNIPIEIYELLTDLANESSQQLGMRVTVPGQIGLLATEEKKRRLEKK